MQHDFEHSLTRTGNARLTDFNTAANRGCGIIFIVSHMLSSPVGYVMGKAGGADSQIRPVVLRV